MHALLRGLAAGGLLGIVAIGCSRPGASAPPDGPVADPCAHVTCSGHGTCASSSGTASCSCAPGYHAAGALCISDGATDLCAGLTTDKVAHPSSWDSGYLGLRCQATGNAFVYELGSGAAFAARAGTSAPSISASGTLAYWGGKVVDRALNTVRTLDLASPEEHCSLGMLANGHDTYNLVQFDAGPGGSGVGSLVTFDMTDGSSRVIVGPSTGYPYPPTATHVSAPIYSRHRRSGARW